MGHFRTGAAAIFSLIVLSACTSTPVPVSNDTSCKYAHVADYPVTFHGRDIPVIILNIDGHLERMMVDSGSDASFLTETAYGQMHRFFLDTNFVDIDSYGIAGRVEIRKEDRLDVQMGPLVLTKQYFLISSQMISAKYGDAGIDGIIGNNILRQLDEAYDLPHRVLGFYGTLDCQTMQTPWIGDYSVTPIKYTLNGSAAIPFLIDDHAFFGIIDTGTEKTFVTQQALDRSNIEPESQKFIASHALGYGGFMIKTKIERFKSVSIGAEEFGDSWLLVGDTQVSKLVDVIIGADFLATHRVFVDNFNANAYLGLSISNIKN